jgi:hypothetical protein
MHPRVLCHTLIFGMPGDRSHGDQIISAEGQPESLVVTKALVTRVASNLRHLVLEKRRASL